MDKRCSKCDVLKPASEYYTYFHRPQGKWRTRNICNVCVVEQKRLYKLSKKQSSTDTGTSILEETDLNLPNFNPIIVDDISIQNEKIIEPTPVSVNPDEDEDDSPYANNPEYKKCRTCKEYVHLSMYYHHNKKTSYLDCRPCCNTKERNLRREERQEELETSGGSEKVKTKVGQWTDEYQKQQTTMVLNIMGYYYDEVSGHFLKPGVKEYINGKIKFLNVVSVRRTSKHYNYDNPIWDEIYFKYQTGRYTYKDLSEIYDFSDSTICKYVQKRNKNNKL